MDYRQIVRQEAQAIGLDPDLAEATMFQESRGNPNAVSPAGARGLMQLMPGTAKELGVDPNDPLENIRGGVRYLKQQTDQFGIPGGLAAYNAGPGRYGKTGGDFNALPTETQKYVPQILNRAAKLSQGVKVADNAPPASNIARLMNALEGAKAQNNEKVVADLTNVIQAKLTEAKTKAEAEGNTAVSQDINTRMQQLFAPRGTTNEMGTETVPVAPPTEPQAAPLAPPPAVPEGVSTTQTEVPATPPVEGQPVEQASTTPQPDLSFLDKVKVKGMNAYASAEDKLKALTKITGPELTKGVSDFVTGTGSFADQATRQLGLTGRYALQGAEKAFTFPVRAAGEAGASLLSLAGAPEAGKAVSGALGFNAPSVGAQAADIAGLPKPQGEFEKTVGTGAETLAGLIAGGGVGALAPTASTLSKLTTSALFPTATTKGQAAIFGGTGMAMEAAPEATIAGLGGVLAAGAAGAAGKKAYQNVRTDRAMKSLLEKAGGKPDLAKVDAEIKLDINRERNNYINDAGKGAPPLGTSDLNQAVAGKYIREVETLIGKLPKDTPARDEILSKLRTGVNLSRDEVYALRDTKLGDIAADAIEKAQRVYALTAPTEASGGFIGNVARSAVDVAPVVTSAMTGIPVAVPQNILAGFKRILGGGETRKQAGSSLTEKYPLLAAEKYIAKEGPSNAATSAQQLSEMVAKTDKQRLAQEAVNKLEKTVFIEAKKEASTAAEQLRQSNLKMGIEPSPKLMPQSQIGGGPKATLQYYGRLKDAKEVSKGLDIIAEEEPYLRQYIEKLKDNQKIPKSEMLLHISDRLLMMRDQGILQPFMKTPK